MAPLAASGAARLSGTGLGDVKCWDAGDGLPRQLRLIFGELHQGLHLRRLLAGPEAGITYALG